MPSIESAEEASQKDTATKEATINTENKFTTHGS